MTMKVNGGIINSQTLTGGMRFFKITGPFAWAVSDGSVNLPVSITGGNPPTTTYFVVGNNRPVPNSAAEIVLQEISKKADIVLIGLVPGTHENTTQLDIAVSASSFGWGANTPAYDVPPANQDQIQLPTTPTAAAVEMQAAIRALPNANVYVSVGAANPAAAPVLAITNFSSCTVTEVSFALGSLTYYNLA